MDMNLKEIGERIQNLREICDYSPEEMAEILDVSVEQYKRREAGEEDFSFTFLFKCGKALGVDMIELLTGETPHLKGYTLNRSGEGLSIKRRAGFEYLHLAANFNGKSAEPFLVTAPYVEEEQETPIHLSYHAGREFDYIIEGNLRFQYEDHTEDLGPGDSLFYDSGRGHGMIATSQSGCKFLAIVMHDMEENA